MKNFQRYCLLLFVLPAIISCERKDPKPDSLTEEEASGISRIKYTSAGTFQNGEYLLIDNPEAPELRASGVTAEEKAILSFVDDKQELTMVLMFPATTGTHLITDESVAYIQYHGYSKSIPTYLFTSVSGSITVDEIETTNISLPNEEGGQLITRAKGTFSALLEGTDFTVAEELNHTQQLSGNFELYAYPIR